MTKDKKVKKENEIMDLKIKNKDITKDKVKDSEVKKRIGLIQIDGKMPNLALMKLAQFHKQKGNIVPSNKRFNELIEKNPLSWAMTSTLAIEYTLEEPAKLP